LRVYRQKQGSPEASALEQKLLQVQEGGFYEADSLLDSYFANPDAAQAGLVLEAVVERSLRGLEQAAFTAGAAEEEISPPPLARLRDAVELWLAQRDREADQVQGLVWRARLRASVWEYTPALADLRNALARNPDDFQARWFLALAVVNEAPEESLTHMEVLYKMHPENRRVCFFLAAMRRSLGRLDAARPMLDEILANNPNHVPALVERGKVSMDLQQPADAEFWLRQAEKLAPNSTEIIQELSRCLLLAGRVEEAEYYRKRFEKLRADHLRKQDELLAKSKSAREARRQSR
jgi:tetratricopeptide (TPR) repeat protein